MESRLSLADLEEALPCVDFRQSLLPEPERDHPVSSSACHVQASLGHYVTFSLSQTWHIIQMASKATGFPLNSIEHFGKNGLYDGLIPYTAQHLEFLPAQFCTTFLKFQNLYLAVDFDEKQHRVLNSEDFVPFVKDPRDRGMERRGSFGVVYKVREGDCVYACKEMSLSNVAEKERRILADILPESSHLLKLRASYVQNDHLYLILYPWVECDLERFFSHRDAYPWWKIVKQAERARSTILSWMSCLAATLATLHSFKIKHMDLKPNNIGLAVQNDIVVPYILDYGCSKSFVVDSQSIDPSGCYYYASPEKRVGKLEGRKGDIFSLGIVIYELACVLAPGARRQFNKLMQRTERRQWWNAIAMQGKHTEVLKFLPSDENSFWGPLTSLLRRMLDQLPENRPTAKEVWEQLKAIQECMNWAIHCVEKPKSPSPIKLSTVVEKATKSASEEEEDDDDDDDDESSFADCEENLL